MQWQGTTTNQIPTAQPTMPPQGNTPASVAADFPAVMVYDFQTNPNINAQFATWAPIYVARLSTEYYRLTNGNIAPLMNVAAEKLSAANLAVLASAMGQAATAAAVSGHSSASVKAAFFALPAQTPLPRSIALYEASGLAYSPNPQITMTLYDIFLEFYAVEGATVTSALYQAAKYASADLGIAFSAGYYGAKGVMAILEEIDPGINDALASELGGLIEDGVNYIDIPGVDGNGTLGDFTNTTSDGFTYCSDPETGAAVDCSNP